MSRKSTEPYIATYLHSKGRRLGLPIAGNFELTARCNFNCPMCYVHQSAESVEAAGGELTAAQWLDIAAAAQKKGMVFALLTGGEPLVRKDFFEIYDGMKKLGLLISINTNGSMLSGEILERFIQDPPARFNISLYGGSNETYRDMCGLPAYDRVKENIRALRKAGISVSLNLSITPYNCHDLQRIYADAVELDVNVRASNYMYPPIRINGEQYGCGNRMTAEEAARCGVEWDVLRFTEEEFALRAKNMELLADMDRDGCPMEEGEGIRCRAGTSSFWVTWDGRILPCGMMTKPSIDLLGLGFDAAWEQLRVATAEIRMPAACGSCSHKDICGVCAAVCLTETGRFDGVPEYVCEKARHTVRLTKQAFAERETK
jgi:radical SAM protein with 4Fe4S-binding SPASM domain